MAKWRWRNGDGEMARWRWERTQITGRCEAVKRHRVHTVVMLQPLLLITFEKNAMGGVVVHLMLNDLSSESGRRNV